MKRAINLGHKFLTTYISELYSWFTYHDKRFSMQWKLFNSSLVCYVGKVYWTSQRNASIFKRKARKSYSLLEY